MMKTAIAFAAALVALVAIPEYASAHQSCGWKRSYNGQRVWVCAQQQPAAHYYRRNPPRMQRHQVFIAATAPMQGQICPQTGQVLMQTTIQPQQSGWQPTVDCNKVGGKRVINPNTGNPSCLVP